MASSPNVVTYLNERIDTMLDKMEMIKLDIKKREVSIEDIESHKESIATIIAATSRQAITQAITHVNQQEKHLMEELEEFVNRDRETLTSAVKICQNDLQMYQQYTELITNALTSGSAMDMFEIYQSCQTGDINVAVNKDAVFVNNPEIKKLCFMEELSSSKLMTDLSLGRLVKDYLSTCTPVLQDTIDTSVDSDEEDPDPADVVVLDVDAVTTPVVTDDTIDIVEEDPDPADVVVLDVDAVTTLVVTDFKNQCIKSFYTRDNQQYHSKLSLEYRPHAITIIDSYKVVVSYWNHEEFTVVLVTPDLAPQSTIKTSKRYRCVTALSTSTLAAGCPYPPSVDILDMAGTVLKCLKYMPSALCPLKSPVFMCTTVTNEGNILISDNHNDNDSVYCVTPEGDVQFTYHCTGRVGSITTSTTGHILVVDYFNDKVIQLTGTGKFYRELLTSHAGNDRSCGICLYGDKLYIAVSGKVKMYRLQ